MWIHETTPLPKPIWMNSFWPILHFFALQHYPIKESDQLLEHPVTFDSFLHAPGVSTAAIQKGLRVVSPRISGISTTETKPVNFVFTCEKPITKATLEVLEKNADSPAYFRVALKQSGQQYTCSFKFERKGDYKVTFYFDSVAMVYYDVHVNWK
jgi:hypothetical protein